MHLQTSKREKHETEEESYRACSDSVQTKIRTSAENSNHPAHKTSRNIHKYCTVNSVLFSSKSFKKAIARRADRIHTILEKAHSDANST